MSGEKTQAVFTREIKEMFCKEGMANFFLSGNATGFVRG